VLKPEGFGDLPNQQEKLMRSLATKVATLAALLIAIAVSPSLPARADGGGGGGGGGGGAEPPPSPPPPAASSSSSSSNHSMTAAKKKKHDKKSEIDFIQGYQHAWLTIYERNDYRSAIDQLHALKHDEHPDVANLIGYSYRKLGEYDQSKTWYEAALKSDPNHVRTWQYYGLWQIEQGHRDQAEIHLQKIGSICGTTCPEYRSLAAALDVSAQGGHVAY
jgi:Tetratricopeptide repeat